MKGLKRIKQFIKKHAGKALSFLLMTLSLSSLFISIGSISTAISTTTSDAVVSAILDNNKTNKFSLWTVKSTEQRNNWLGGDIKPWLYSLSNSWSVFDDDEHNHNFLITFASQEQTFMTIGEDKIPISIIASPTPSSLSYFKLKIDDGKSAFDGKESFYISQSLYNKAGTMDCSLQIMNNTTNVKFSGVVTSSKNQIVQDLGLTDYIVVPTNKAYDMEHYTGKSTFVSILFNDYYQNYFCVKRFEYIDHNVKIMHSVYTTSYLDKLSDLNKDHSEVMSNIQNVYDNATKQSKTSLWFVFSFLALMIVLSLSTFFCLKKNRKDLMLVLRYSPLLVLMGLIVYSLAQMLAFKFAHSYWMIWSIQTQLVMLLVGGFLIICLLIANYLLKKRVSKEVVPDKDSYFEIDI